jgi:hypothetical protein
VLTHNATISLRKWLDDEQRTLSAEQRAGEEELRADPHGGFPNKPDGSG